MSDAPAPPPPSPEAIAQVRAFNRFHTRLVGALNEHMLASGYSLPQIRVLYEVATAPSAAPPSASDLARRLQMDTGYLSRVLAGLEGDGLIRREPTQGNARRLALVPTEAGRAAYAGLDRASAAEVAALLAPLGEAERRQLVGAMATLRRLLGDAPAAGTVVLREPEPGDLGWVVHRQTRLYAAEYGWDGSFEGLAAEIAGRFVTEFRPGLERGWIAERDGEILGSVLVVRQDEETAKLRLLYVEPAARGTGLGRQLVEQCLRFARAAGYARMVLWTNDVLVAARRVYEAAGFALVGEEAHHSFGKDLVGQTWEKRL